MEPSSDHSHPSPADTQCTKESNVSSQHAQAEDGSQQLPAKRKRVYTKRDPSLKSQTNIFGQGKKDIKDPFHGNSVRRSQQLGEGTHPCSLKYVHRNQQRTTLLNHTRTRPGSDQLPRNKNGPRLKVPEPPAEECTQQAFSTSHEPEDERYAKHLLEAFSYTSSRLMFAKECDIPAAMYGMPSFDPEKNQLQADTIHQTGFAAVTGRTPYISASTV